MRLKYIIFFLFISIAVAAQDLKPIYLLFNDGSEELCNVVKSRGGNFHERENVLKYGKGERSDGVTRFYICSELFENESKMERKIVSNEFLKDKKLMEYQELAVFLNKMQDKYPYGPRYPTKEYPKLYVPIRISDSETCLYEVRFLMYH